MRVLTIPILGSSKNYAYLYVGPLRVQFSFLSGV